MKKQTKKTNPAINKTAVGAGLAAVAAAAIAGTYFLYGSKNAPKHRKQVKAWSLKARGEVLERLEKLSKVDEAAYHRAIREVKSRYKTLKRLDPKDVVEFVGELKDQWRNIAKEIGIAATAPRSKHRSTKKASKKK